MSGDAIVELDVEDRVPDIMKHAIRVEKRKVATRIEILWPKRMRSALL